MDNIIRCRVKSTFIKFHKGILGFILAAGAASGSHLVANEVNNPTRLRLPAGVHSARRVWYQGEEFEFTRGVYGRYGLYADVPQENIVDWVKSQDVDPWLNIHSWDASKATVSISTQDMLSIEWVELCNSPRKKFHLLSFFRKRSEAGESFWFGLHLYSWVGRAKLKRLGGMFDSQWRMEGLHFESLSVKSIFYHREPLFKGASQVKTLSDAISLVASQLGDSDKKALRGLTRQEQIRVARERGILEAIRSDFELDSNCAPLANVRRRSDGAILPYSWVPEFIIQGVAAKIDELPFDVEGELSKAPLIPASILKIKRRN